KESSKMIKGLFVSVLFIFVLVTINAQEIHVSTEQIINLKPGRHLFIDDYIVAQSKGLESTLHQPVKMGSPVLEGMGSDDNNFQPYATVLYDMQRQRFRIWYCSRVNRDEGIMLSYAESVDGINWEKPYQELFEIYGFGCSVIDDGPEATIPERRYKMIYWELGNPERRYYNNAAAGIGVSFSADGLNWVRQHPHPVLPDLWSHSIKGDPDHKGSIKWREYAADIVHATWDPIRNIYVAYVKSWTWPPDEFGYISPTSDGMGRRLVSMTSSSDFVHWSKPVRSFLPQPDDFSSLEFYACRAKPRGNQMVNFSCILNEEIEGKSGSGIGYTVLSVSNDLVNWNRMKEPWLPRSNENPEAADHAVAWVADVITVGDEEFIYYGGYSDGHKSYDDRTINLAHLRKDGFVSRDAGKKEGRLLTKILRLDAGDLTINANVSGILQMRVLEPSGKPLKGFGKNEIELISGDATNHRVKTKGNLASLAGKPVRLEFFLRDAKLYGFELHETK
ncbi:hypothetical protein ACFL46_06335, partial [Candidatus Neomarinimicrobiota bacterium]